MRLLFVSHSFPPDGAPLTNLGGMQRVATELYEVLQENPSVELIPLVLRSSWESSKRKGPFFLIKSLFVIRQLAKKEAVDVILFSSMVTAPLSVALKKRLRKSHIKTATIVHGESVTLPIPIFRSLIPKVFDALDAVMPVSRATAEQCIKRGLQPHKLHVIPNGVKLSRFKPLSDRATMRRELVDAAGDAAAPLPPDALLLCSVGRQVPRKGFAWFVENVMPQLPEDVHYWLAGDGPEAEHIEQAAKEKGVEHRVRRLGRVTDEQLALLYRGADLFVMPNIPVPGTMEGFGVVMLEAGMGGQPAIAARLEGIQDVITEGKNGHYVESGDVQGFVRAILAYHHQPEKLAAASRSAYKHTAGTFSWHTVAEQYIKVLEGLCAD